MNHLIILQILRFRVFVSPLLNRMGQVSPCGHCWDYCSGNPSSSASQLMRLTNVAYPTTRTWWCGAYNDKTGTLYTFFFKIVDFGRPFSEMMVENQEFRPPFYGTNNCWFPLARKWPTWKWTWIWIPYGKIEKKCPRYFRRDSRVNPRDLNMCRTGRTAALSRGRKSMPPRRESMKLVVQQRKFT